MRVHHVPPEGRNSVALGSPKKVEPPKRLVVAKTTRNRLEREPRVGLVRSTLTK